MSISSASLLTTARSLQDRAYHQVEAVDGTLAEAKVADIILAAGKAAAFGHGYSSKRSVQVSSKDKAAAQKQ